MIGEKNGLKGMVIYSPVDMMKQARASLGNVGALDEALVATGIDAFFHLLDGGRIRVDDQWLELVKAEDAE